jgi:AcrR family transcriptional regulator
MNAKVASRPRMSSEERKACIVDAACRLFSEKGFRGVTTRELAAAVGVSEPVLYEHFRTKRDLYNAIIEAKASQGIEVVNRISEQFRKTDDDRAFFGALARSILDWYTNDPAIIRLLLYSNLEGHDLKQLFHERSKQCFELVSMYVARRIEEGRIRKVDPAVAARAFFGMIAHYALHAVIFNVSPIPRPPQRVISEMVDLYLNGLRTERKTDDD